MGRHCAPKRLAANHVTQAAYLPPAASTRVNIVFQDVSWVQSASRWHSASHLTLQIDSSWIVVHVTWKCRGSWRLGRLAATAPKQHPAHLLDQSPHLMTTVTTLSIHCSLYNKVCSNAQPRWTPAGHIYSKTITFLTHVLHTSGLKTFLQMSNVF